MTGPITLGDLLDEIPVTRTSDRRPRPASVSRANQPESLADSLDNVQKAGESAKSGRTGKSGKSGKSGFTLSLKGRALRYLAAREHSRSELERKLASHEETPGQLAGVLDELQAKDFISDARVVESVINRRASKMGAARVRQELQGKGLDAALITGAVASLQSTEYERALELWRRKFGELSADPKVRAKQARFLMSRGFSGGIVARILRFGGAGDEE
ncbi:MAG: recombination regulator RecX [Comamonadaceae bacterium]|nr:MAG: recombination regulator RecX [Comamonadaceae bacterium]